MYYVKFWTVYPVSVYVREKRCNETRFVLFNTVGKFFLVFILPLLCKGYYIAFIVFWRRVGGPGKARKVTAWLGMF